MRSALQTQGESGVVARTAWRAFMATYYRQIHAYACIFTAGESTAGARASEGVNGSIAREGHGMRIAMLGSGGIGGYFGARLARGGHDGVFGARGAHPEAPQ